MTPLPASVGSSTPFVLARWPAPTGQNLLRPATAQPPPAKGQRRREEPSSGRGKAKRTTFSGSDSDSAPHPRRTERDRRQVPPVIFHAAETDSDTPSFPPRIFRPRVTQRLPSRTVHDLSSTVHGSDAASAPSLNQMVEAVTAAAIAAVDRHLERLGLCIAPTVPHPDSAAAPHTVSPVERTTPVAPYTAPVTHPAMTPPGTVLPSSRAAYFGCAAYCTPFGTLRPCSNVHGPYDPPSVPRDAFAGYCIFFGRVAPCTPSGRGANDTPCNTVHGLELCAPPPVHRDDLAEYCTPLHELWVDSTASSTDRYCIPTQLRHHGIT